MRPNLKLVASNEERQPPSTKAKLRKLSSLKRNRELLDMDYVGKLEDKELEFMLKFAEDFTRQGRYRRENDLTTCHDFCLLRNTEKFTVENIPEISEDLAERLEREKALDAFTPLLKRKHKRRR